MSTETVDTKKRILDAGVLLFAEHGFAGTSVRAITAAAETNLNAINYHFGSKEGLFRAVARQVMKPLNEEHLRRLNLLEVGRSETGEVASVEELIDAYASPFVELLERDKEYGQLVTRLVARVLADADGSAERAALDEIEEVEDRYLGAFARALPHLGTDELWWRFRMTTVVIAFHWIVVAARSRPLKARPKSEGNFSAWMRAYLAAAMSAPSGATRPVQQT